MNQPYIVCYMMTSVDGRIRLFSIEMANITTLRQGAREWDRK